MTLDLQSDQNVFFQDFGEAGQVHPVGQASRPVTLIVHRDQPIEQPDGGARRRSYRIEIKNNQITGMTADECVQETDSEVPEISFYQHYGDTTFIRKPINRLIRHNGGVLLVEVTL